MDYSSGLSDAYLDGWFSHMHGVLLEMNPYNERWQARSNVQWDRGWSARFSACKHGRDLAVDDKLHDYPEPF